MILIDTSTLIDALTGLKRSGPTLRREVERGERVFLNTLVLYEWLRGPRTSDEIEDQEALFPGHRVLPFLADDAILSAELYRYVARPRGREIDLAIAAIAIHHEAPLWTLNTRDFEDIPRLHLFRPPQ